MNTASLTQSGSGNSATETQIGSGDTQSIVQLGAHNVATYTQLGANLPDLEVNQTGGMSIGILQTASPFKGR